MSEQQTPPAAPAPGTEAEAPPLSFGSQGDLAFGDLMDTLVTEAEPETPVAGEPAPAADGGKAGQAAAPAEGAKGADGQPAAPATGADGKPAVPTAGDGTDSSVVAEGPVGGDLPAGWDADSATFLPKLGEIATALEDKVARAHHDEALKSVSTEHAKYFEAIQAPPRTLVGQTVPSTKPGQDTETLSDLEDVKDWQETVKKILVEEVRGIATKSMEDGAEYLNTLHSSIELFQNNVDLIPGTKGFDLELANRFADMSQPYELRVDEKLHGYSIPTQPLIDKIRAQLVKERAAKPPATEAAPAKGKEAAAGKAPAAPEDPPQAGIQSKTGESQEGETYDTLFQTLGFDSAPRF